MGVSKSRTSYFTNRGLHFGNLWEVYSYKKKQRIQIINDFELCYWLLFLEFEPAIKGFEIRPPGRVVAHPKPHKLYLNAETSSSNGQGWDLLFNNSDYGGDSRFRDASIAAREYGADVRVVTLEDVVPLKYKVFPLLRVVSCLAIGDNDYSTFYHLGCFRAYAKKRGSGHLVDFYTHFSDVETSLIHKAVAELFALGELTVELAPDFFCELSEWVYK
ncbi:MULTISPECIES: hypothetical protein [unclassified Pseudomonas]|uniref:hypothetical protein n=1 Tax=unclassified Pseudomonas TaxID=196821 RepID=UPI0011BED200|nr:MULTISPECIES: hypothetical protein [unclassified Pseudomonas]